jgi:putative ABC transport system permease protein
MSFILKMAWRDSRASRRRLLLFSLSIVLGVAALVAIGSFRDNLRQAVADQAKQLLGADLAVTSRQPIPAAVDAYLASLGGESARETSFSSMIVFPSSGGRTRLVQVRALEGAFPFYGRAVTTPAGALAALPAGGRAVLENTLLDQFGLKVGDPVRIGAATFTIAGALDKMPGESPAVAMLAPRVYIPMRALARTQLIQPGSLVRYRTWYRLPATVDVEALVGDLRERFGAQRLGYDTVEHRKRDLGRSLDNVNAFLSLVGFIALFLGAIGVASAIHVHVRQKLATVATLRCLGATARQSFAIYLVQGLGLGAVGAGLGAGLGLAVQLVLPAIFRGLLPVDAAVFFSGRAVADGLAAGLVISVLFTLLPLLAIRRVSPLLALRAGYGEAPPGRDPWRWALYGLIGAAGLGFAVSQAARWQRGVAFALALAAGLGLLAGMARLVAWAARRWVPRRLPYVWRQGVANLHRPHNRTVLLLVSLGLGTFLVLTLSLVRESLLREFHAATGGDRPNLILFDIQDDQLAGVQQVLRTTGAEERQEAPIVTMRISAIRGQPVEAMLRSAGRPGAPRRPGWALRREYRSTYRGRLTDTERVVAGTFVGRVPPGTTDVPVSLEEGLAKELDVRLGDEITFDVQGVPIRTRVASLRAVEWQRMQPNFFVVFPDGVLEGAPQFHVVAVRVRSPAQSAAVQQAVVRAYPNVSAIDLGLILDTFDDIFAKVSLVVRFMAAFVVATGLIVLAGAVLTAQFQRLRESVLLRTLGATRRQVRQIMLVEYGVLGVLAAVTGGLLAVAASALLMRFVFHTGFAAPPLLLLGAVAVVTAVTLATGVVSGRGVCAHPPLAVLRQE